MSGAAVIVALRVGVPPDVAFAAFANDIGQWWKGHPLFQLSRKGDGMLRFDPQGPEGRLVTRFDDGDEWEIGRVRHWVPGERLAFGWRLPSFKEDQATEVDVRFEAVGGETRVTVEHRGWDSIPQKHAARHGFELMLFQRRLGECWQRSLKGMSERL